MTGRPCSDVLDEDGLSEMLRQLRLVFPKPPTWPGADQGGRYDWDADVLAAAHYIDQEVSEALRAGMPPPAP